MTINKLSCDITIILMGQNLIANFIWGNQDFKPFFNLLDFAYFPNLSNHQFLWVFNSTKFLFIAPLNFQSFTNNNLSIN